MNEFEHVVPEEPKAVQRTPSEDSEKLGWGAKWRTASKRWAKETSISYLSNPAARRDFVVQFRGSRSAWLFAAYLLVMGFVALVEYWHMSSQGLSIADLQSGLIDFYRAILAVLGIAITLIAPAMAASAIVAEKQRKSLDLVFTTPVRPRVYLIGKVIAVYRYTWILMALSLPFTAMSVLLGGASWLDVLGTYLMLSVQGLVLTSLGLLFSALAEKTVSALLYTVAGVTAYLVGTGMLAETLRTVSQDGIHRSFFELLNPFYVYDALGSVTVIGGVPVPNVALAVAVCFVMIRLMLGTAGAAVVAPKPRERADLRLSAAGALATLIGICAYSLSRQLSFGNDGQAVPLMLVGLLFVLAVFMPFLSCYGLDGERHAKPSGAVSLAKTLTGTPAGTLPYIWLVVGLSTIATVMGAWLGSPQVSLPLIGIAGFYAAAFWSFFWAVGRLASSFLMGLKASRTIQFLAFVAIVGAPLPVLSFLLPSGEGNQIWQMFPFNTYILSPLMWPNMGEGLLIWGVILSFLTAMVSWWSERNLRHRLMKKGTGLAEVERLTGRFADNVRG